ncbi:zinc fingers and homeoboxes protein 3 isoform X1 [Lampris incognitus]|uniref:zinc fingers and homeoboxes protein 3 isoform X1 n=1 Tax=Lampris incognitus TaxID=2546036 RepID=UPI0024B589FC|nr:zinc fingers and homeoboxes protein 3 isoform X1 [Lampris incognitus]XP_056130781.1 zinc fingers and homeoboxes protein 3 isoform X1 [Lampris incognitus]XP_056130782.1 zinc fingers and homeoboxes protein 3 isoform X1 [Lampris incognitus]
MASKRKSTTPCMIPSKTMYFQEELEQEPPVPLHQARSSGGGRHSPFDIEESSKPERGDSVKDGAGTYTCRPCNFETHDLNLFLDHVYSGHPDFRADPSFLCVDCGVSAPKFEGLALHNARVHPSTLNTTLQLRKRERRVVVEQNLIMGTDMVKDTEISITRTPIMRMLKGKSEPKRIVVSHPPSDESSSDPNSVTREAERKETSTVTVTHVPTIVHNGATNKVTLPSAIQIVNGSGTLPMLKTAITQVVSVVQSRSLHQSAPITVSSSLPSSSSPSAASKNLPKVMIPLSSIPTYSASMDSSSFLKTSFSKFPYPTKAELCYLTVVTKFPEEQIKIWFTAQRLKQGISWSPEEIEEARRKMFNTIIQTAPPSSQNQRQTQSHQSPSQHTITVLPASLGSTGIPHILQGSLVGQGGVIVTQPVMANGIQVSSAPVALAVTPKPQAAARPMMQARPAAALVADKGIGVVVGSSSGSNNISSSSRNGAGSANTIIISSSGSNSNNGSNNTSNEASVINLSLGNSNHSNVNGKLKISAGDLNDKSNSDATSDATTAKGKSDCKKKEISDNSSSTFNNNGENETPDTKSSTGSKSNNGKNTSNGQKSKDANSSNNTPSAATTQVVPTTDISNSPVFRTEASSSPTYQSSSPSPGTPSSSIPGSRTLPNMLLDPSFYKGKKSQEQLNALKDSFQINQFPNQEEVDRLIALTGLTVREVRKWFSDRRYHFRNLKGTRSSTGSQSKCSATAGAGGGSTASGSSTPGSSAISDNSDNNTASGAKTPQQGSAPLSPNASQTPTSPTTPSRRPPRPPSPDFTAIRYKEREPHQVKALEASFAQDPDPSGEEVDRLRAETKMTRREIHGWFAEKRKRVAAEKKKEEAERAVREEEEGMEADGEEGKSIDGAKKEDSGDRQKEDSSLEPKVNPIKINLKMLKVTEANGKPESEGSDNIIVPPTFSTTPTTSPGATQSSNPKPAQSPKPSLIRGKKTAEQLHLLKLVYARTQWPSAPQYDELISATGLPRPEVVRWFGDCRYVQKNGQLKWLESYQSTALEEDLQKGNTQILQAHLDAHGSLVESQLQELAQASGLTKELVQRWFSTKSASPLQAEENAAADKTGPGAQDPLPELQMGGFGASLVKPCQAELQEEDVEQSLCGITKEGEGDWSYNTVNPTEGTK